MKSGQNDNVSPNYGSIEIPADDKSSVVRGWGGCGVSCTAPCRVQLFTTLRNLRSLYYYNNTIFFSSGNDGRRRDWTRAPCDRVTSTPTVVGNVITLMG